MHLKNAISQINRRCSWVGDRKYDVNGAKKMGVDSMGVLYGFGSREELEEAGATYIVDTVKDLEEIFCEME